MSFSSKIPMRDSENVESTFGNKKHSNGSDLTADDNDIDATIWSFLLNPQNFFNFESGEADLLQEEDDHQARKTRKVESENTEIRLALADIPPELRDPNEYLLPSSVTENITEENTQMELQQDSMFKDLQILNFESIISQPSIGVLDISSTISVAEELSQQVKQELKLESKKKGKSINPSRERKKAKKIALQEELARLKVEYNLLEKQLLVEGSKNVTLKEEYSSLMEMIRGIPSMNELIAKTSALSISKESVNSDRKPSPPK